MRLPDPQRSTSMLAEETTHLNKGGPAMKQDQQDSAKTNAELNNAPSPLSSAVGIDLGDRWSRYCVVNSVGEVVIEDRVRTTPEGMERLFQEMPATRVVIEAAAHSPWVSRQLESYGHQ